MLFPQVQGKRVPDHGSAEHEGALVLIYLSWLATNAANHS